MSNLPVAEAETILCFDDPTLRKYLHGRADDDLAGRIEVHVSDCSKCDANLTRVERESSQDADAFISSLGQLNRLATNASSAHGSSRSANDISDVVKRIKQLRAASTPTTAPMQTVLPGRELGAYELLEPIGQGGMGVVFRANHKRLGKEFAVKVLPASAPQAAGTLDRFQQEVATAGRLQHDAIVQATDAGEEDGVSYLVMELVDGVDLSFLLKHVGQLDVGSAAEIIRQAAIGLEYAHQQGVIHRDIKPSNLMLHKTGRLRILDFGLAQSNAWYLPHGDLTTVGQLLGTLDYMAPEQADAADAVDHRADIYSLGATFYCLLAGRAPYAATPRLSPLEKLRLIATQKPATLRAIRNDVPEELDKYVSSLLSHDRSERPMSAAHVAEAVAKYSDADRLCDVTGDIEELNRLSREAVEVDWPPTESSSRSHSINGPETQKKQSKNWLGIVFAFIFLGSFLAAAIVFAIDLNRGQLVIESEVADVTVSLHKNGKPYDTIEIKPGTQATKLFADEYQITIAAGSDNVSIDNESFVLKRGEMVVARVKTKDQPTGQQTIRDETNDSAEPLYSGKTLADCLRIVRVERDPAAVAPASQGLMALCSDSSREEIKETLLKILLEMDTSRSNIDFASENAIMVLSNILPPDERNELFEVLLANDDLKLVAHVLDPVRQHLPTENFVDEIGRRLTVDVKQQNKALFDKITQQLIRYLDSHAAESAADFLVESPALDDQFWLSTDWSHIQNAKLPTRLSGHVIRRSISEIQRARFDERFCMAMRNLRGWPHSNLVTDSFLEQLAIIIGSAIVQDDRKFIRLTRIHKNPPLSDILRQMPTSRRNLQFAIDRSERSSGSDTTPILSMLNFVANLERPLPKPLLTRVQTLSAKKREASSAVETWRSASFLVRIPSFSVDQITQRSSRTTNPNLSKTIRSQPKSFWYDALIYQAANYALLRQPDESPASRPNRPAASPSKPPSGISVNPAFKPARKPSSKEKEITYAGKTLSQGLDTIRWERQPELLDAAFKGLSALATDKNRERIAKVIVETIPEVDGARQRVGDSAFDKVAIRKLEAILPRERFNEEIASLLHPDRPKVAMRVVRVLNGQAQMDALGEIAKLIDVPECSFNAARSLANLMSYGDINVRNKVAGYLTDAKSKTFWSTINWANYLQPTKFDKDHYPAEFISRIMTESMATIANSNEYDHAFCGACINLASWADAKLIDKELSDEAFHKTLVTRFKEMRSSDSAAAVVITPSFGSNQAKPWRSYDDGSTAVQKILLPSVLSERTTPMFALLSLIVVLPELPEPLIEDLRATAASKPELLDGIDESQLRRHRFNWPHLDERFLKKSRKFWHDYFVARQAEIILARHNAETKP